MIKLIVLAVIYLSGSTVYDRMSSISKNAWLCTSRCGPFFMRREFRVENGKAKIVSALYQIRLSQNEGPITEETAP